MKKVNLKISGVSSPINEKFVCTYLIVLLIGYYLCSCGSLATSRIVYLW